MKVEKREVKVKKMVEVEVNENDGVILELTKHEIDCVMAIIGLTGGHWENPIRRVIDPLYKAISNSVYGGAASNKINNPMIEKIDKYRSEIITIM